MSKELEGYNKKKYIGRLRFIIEDIVKKTS